MEEFLIGAGFALVIALLAWSDQIRNLHHETLELEKEFSRNRNLDLRSMRLIIRSERKPAKRITAINELLNHSKLKSTADVGFISELISININRNKLDDLYKLKYLLVIIITHVLIFSGVINYFIPKCSYINIFGICFNPENIPIFGCILLILSLIWFTLYINKVENKYILNLNKLMDLI